MRLEDFLQLSADHKATLLKQLIEHSSPPQDGFLFALTTVCDNDLMLRSLAMQLLPRYRGVRGWFDPSGLDSSELRQRASNALQTIRHSEARLLEFEPEESQIDLNKDLRLRTRDAKRDGRWEGDFPRKMAILNALRNDTLILLKQVFKKEDIPRLVFPAFDDDSLIPFRDGIKSLDDITAVNIVNLGPRTETFSRYPGISELAARIEHPHYLLVILTDTQLVLFMRDHLQSTRASALVLPHTELERTARRTEDKMVVLELHMQHRYLEIPALRSDDAMKAEQFLRERAVASIQASEDLIDLNIDREIQKLEMLYRTGNIDNHDYLFRKMRLQKMELEKYSEQNLDVLLARRFQDGSLGTRIDDELLRKFMKEKTVMFTDMVGFSSKAAQKFLLDTVSMLAFHDRTLMPAIEKRGGVLIKKIGDALMVSFDDPASACLAAREMQAALVEANRNSSEKMLIRIGINTGTVFVKKQDVFGDAVNVAARMESMAEPGMILITEATRERIRDRFQTRDLGHHQVKGQKVPVHIHALVDETHADEEMLNNARELGFSFGASVKSVAVSREDISVTSPEIHPQPLSAEVEHAPVEPSPASEIKPAEEEIKPVSETTDEIVKRLKQDVITAFRTYSAAVAAGLPRSPAVENWFQQYLRDLHPELEKYTNKTG